jgi:anti-anti-sigma factor
MDELTVRLPAAPPGAYRRYVAWWREVAKFAAEASAGSGGTARPPLADGGFLRGLPAERAADLDMQVTIAERDGVAEVEPVLSGDVTLWLMAVAYGERTTAWLQSLSDAGVEVPRLDPETDKLRQEVLHTVRAALEAAEVLLRLIPGAEPGSFRLMGELDMSYADMLAEAFDAELAMGNQLTLDLSELTFMDSTGIRLLISLGRKAQSLDLAPVVIVSPSAGVRHILDIALPSGIPGIEFRDGGSAPGAVPGPLFFTL